ncbi:fimbrial protein [Providencia rettgeri]|nr:fimbrial protein [Providencia rettgeri]
MWNGGSDPIECTPPSVNSRDYGVELRTGSSGTITFRLKNRLLMALPSTKLSWYRFLPKRQPSEWQYSLCANPFNSGCFRSRIITVADECTINEGNPINIDFLDVANTSEQLNGINYAQPFKIPVKCTGGSFTTGDLNIKLSLLPGASGSADFNPDYFGTLKTA